MRKSTPILLASLFAMLTMAGHSMADTISDLKWEKRIVIVFSSDADQLETQRRAFLSDEAALAERQMLVFAVAGDALQAIYGSVPDGETADDLRRRFGVLSSDSFTAILIGKDGGVKWRGREPVESAAINAIIDAMPMRRSGG